MSQPEFRETSDPTASQVQRQEHTVSALNQLMRQHGVTPSERAAWSVPFDAATGVITGEEPPVRSGSTGAAGPSWHMRAGNGPSMSRADMERQFPVMRGRT